MSYSEVTLTGTYLLPDKTPAQGVVEIIPSERLIVDDAGDVILSGRVKATLDEAGHFSVNLPATDDTNLTPSGFGYTAAAKLHHAHLPAVSFSLPAAMPIVDITDVTTVDPSTFAPDANYVTDTELATKADAADVVALEEVVETGRLSEGELSATYAAVVGIGPASGVDDTAHINALLAANPGTTVRGTPGEAYKISDPLVVRTGTTLDMTGCTITLLAGSDSRMVQNYALSGVGARDVDIHIKGGYWDRGANGGTTSNDQHSFVMHRADRVSITDIRFTATGACKYAVYFVDVTDALAARLYITNTSDGVHVTGPASRVTVRDVSGYGDDDIVSFTGRDYTSFELTAGGGNISDIVVERIVCRGGLDPNTVKLLPGAAMTLSNAVVRDISGVPATSAVVLYNDTVQASTTGGTLSGIVIDGVSGAPGQRYVNVAHPDVRNLVIRNVTVAANPARAISFSGGTGAVVTDCIIDGVTANDTFNQSLIHVGNPTTVNRLSISNVSIRSTGATTYFLNTDGNIGSLQVTNVHQIAGYGGVVIGGGTCPLITINGYHSTATNNLIRVGASVPVEAHVSGITAYPTSQLAIVVGATGSLILRVGNINEGAGPHIVRTASQTIRATGAAAKMDVGLLTGVAGDIVNNTNAARSCGVGPCVYNGTTWKNLYTAATF